MRGDCREIETDPLLQSASTYTRFAYFAYVLGRKGGGRGGGAAGGYKFFVISRYLYVTSLVFVSEMRRIIEEIRKEMGEDFLSFFFHVFSYVCIYIYTRASTWLLDIVSRKERFFRRKKKEKKKKSIGVCEDVFESTRSMLSNGIYIYI